MVKPFPIRELSLFSLAEALSRVLGLLFLARFVTGLGLAESASLRMLLPLVSVVAAFSSIGLPQALTRLFASAMPIPLQPVPHTMLRTLRQSVCCAVVLTFFAWWLLVRGANLAWLFKTSVPLSALFGVTLPLLLLMCVTGSLRGALLGLGSTYAPALAQVIEVSFRLLALLLLLPVASEIGSLSGAQFGIVTLTVGEAAAAVFLGGMLLWRLRLVGVWRERRRESAYAQISRLLTVLRMSLATSGQALLASLGFALELPLAKALLSHAQSPAVSAQWIGEYAAIALPLLCAPMVLTDGMAQALLPITASERATQGLHTLAITLHRVFGAVALVALPVTGTLLVLAPVLTAWYGAPSAALMLMLLSPLTGPLYLQAPLAALLQAHGFSRGLLYAGLVGDLARLGGLLLWLGVGQMGRGGLALSFACSVCLQTAVLWAMTRRIIRFSVPWRTLCQAAEAACLLVAVLLIGLHAPSPWGLVGHPLLWLVGAWACAALFLLFAGVMTPLHLARLPGVGRPLRKVGEQVVQWMADKKKEQA